ncbi:MAG TPA: helix-hairpin-helix domain-containing protein [Myxococcota bacterium]
MKALSMRIGRSARLILRLALVALAATVLTPTSAAAQLLSPMVEPMITMGPALVSPVGGAVVTSEPVPSAPSASVLVNVNTATIDELCTLPGIGQKKAEGIVALRSRRPLTRVTQLLQVKGIGPRMLQRLKPLVTVTAPKPPAETPPTVGGVPIMASVRRP